MPERTVLIMNSLLVDSETTDGENEGRRIIAIHDSEAIVLCRRLCWLQLGPSQMPPQIFVQPDCSDATQQRNPRKDSIMNVVRERFVKYEPS